MKIRISKYAAICGTFFAAAVLSAEIKLPELFSDGAVFQREKPVKIWGMAEPNAEVGVEFAGQKKSAKADAKGKWFLFLDAMPASAEPREMTVSENGKSAKKVGDILVGEVWILGGQSNMEWIVVNTDDAKEAIARSDYPLLRYFDMPSGLNTETEQFSIPNGKWIHSSPKVSGKFSAVGFYFGEKLMKDLKIPVALVDTAMGGTPMRAWTPAEWAENVPFEKRWFATYKKEREDYLKNGGYEKKVAEMKIRREKYDAACKKADAEGKPRPSLWDFRVSTPLKHTHVSVNSIPIWHWNAKVAPVAGFTARGVLWYQGESDAWGMDPQWSPSFTFGEVYKNMVRAWRARWGSENLFFLAIQLPSQDKSPAWPHVRAQQVEAADALGNAACANIIDTGWQFDVHPHDKTLVGHRAEEIALRNLYGYSSILPTPRAVSVKYKKGGAFVKLDAFGGKLVAKGEPRGFELKIDGKWVEGKPELRKNGVFVAAADSSTKPEGVRYLWKGWAKPDVWIYNSQNTPLFTFKFEETK